MSSAKWPQLVACLYPTQGAATSPLCSKTPSAFGGFGIGKTTLVEEYGVSERHGKLAGCRACRLHISPHCALPHLECAAHALPTNLVSQLERASFLSITGYKQGEVEHCALVRVHSVRLSSLEGTESYPLGDGSDWVISKASLEVELEKLGPLCQAENEAGNGRSILIDIANMSECTEMSADGDWRNWPFLTTEAIEYLSSQDGFYFNHIRLFLPSLERADSQGGMWNHCRWFGLPPERGMEETRACAEKLLADGGGAWWPRTVGEFLHRSAEVEGLGAGWYGLLCPAVDFVGLDFAITCPLLYRL